jgi:hypothetical protein
MMAKYRIRFLLDIKVEISDFRTQMKQIWRINEGFLFWPLLFAACSQKLTADSHP